VALFHRCECVGVDVRKRCYFRRAGRAAGMPVDDPKEKFIALTWRLECGPTKHTKQPSRLLAETPTDDAQELDRAVRLGHVVITAGSPRLRFIALHREGTNGNDWDRGAVWERLDLPRGDCHRRVQLQPARINETRYSPLPQMW
jgi:hypothetical protein